MQIIELSGLTVRTNKEDIQNCRKVFLLLHGWTGDEKSMGIFDRVVLPDALILSPRAPYQSKSTGFSWADDSQLTAWPTFDDLLPSARKLKELVTGVVDQNPALDRKINLIGFSQGAGLSAVFAVKYPELVDSAAFLSGFFPKGPDLGVDQRLKGIRFYAAHGEQDDIVPIERAEKAVGQLQKLGADVDFCKTRVGHKVSLDCYKAMKDFFTQTVLN